jgi:ubiquinone/menaquinone biosynthesis C-methylase UbiE
MINAYVGQDAAARDDAARYDAARHLPSQTKTLWLNALKSSLPNQKMERILDLGCGTGRFTTALLETFGCSVVGVEPSEAMLQVAKAQEEYDIEWKQGHAESIPLENQTIDLVFMSQVFHHLAQKQQALRDISRVMAPSSYLAIRNATRENNQEIEWLQCFPEALQIEEGRMLSQKELTEVVCSESFELISRQTIYQFFASSYREYSDKIRQRGLSSLILISDTAFHAGLERLGQWVDKQPSDLAVYEPVDLFIFQKFQA